MENILNSIKKLLGPDSGQDFFDDEILMHINSTISTLTQIGLDPYKANVVTKDTEWDEIFDVDDVNLQFIRSYIYLKVKLIFDPPTNSTVLNSMESQIKELESRLNGVLDYYY